MICRYCNEERILGKSHVIPESFFPITADDPRPLRLLTNKANEFSKRSRVGVYDKTILCINCERRFDLPDNYAQKILLQNQKHFQPLMLGNKCVGYEISDFDYNLLKCFFVSLLWRASVSTHSFYEGINLGPFESIALNCLKNYQSIPEELFSVNLAKFDDPLGKSILNPHASKLEGVNYSRFYLGGYIAFIKVDKRQTPPPFSSLMMSPGRPLRIVTRDFSNSKELSLFNELVRVSNKHA